MERDSKRERRSLEGGTSWTWQVLIVFLVSVDITRRMAYLYS